MGLLAVLVLAAVFIVWYIVGSVWNRRLARRIANEMKDALLAQGGTSKVQWFGTTAFRMTTQGANPPFGEISVVVTLQSREMPINWGVGLLQGRRDVAVLEASLRKSPRVGFEVVNPESRVGRRRSRARSSWSECTLAGHRFLLATKNESAVRELLENLGGEALPPFSAIHLTAGSEPGIAASLTVVPGRISTAVAALRNLAEKVTT